VNFPLNPDTWTIITDGMAAATTPGLYHTAEAAHMQGIDFAGKTGTAQVVGGGDTHTKGGAKTPNSWFVGMVPRRNPEIVIAVLQEHGDWGSNSARIAAQVVATYVNKKRMQDNNVMEQAGSGKPVEVGAVWSEPAPQYRKRPGPGSLPGNDSVLHAGHFTVDPVQIIAASKTTTFRAPSLRLAGVPTDRSSSVGWSGARVGDHEPKVSFPSTPGAPSLRLPSVARVGSQISPFSVTLGKQGSP
jgi:membrane peptidoglycan carboxypeptidase